jgi:chemotaxis protein histidine kinase CheA
VRNQKLAVTKNLVDLTLKAADLIRSMLDASDSADMAEIGKLSTSSVAVAEQAGQMLLRIVPDIQKTANLVQGDHSCIQ